MASINGIEFCVVNGGLKMVVEGKEYRFDPTEVKALWDLLNEHQADPKAPRPDRTEPTADGRE